MDATDGEQLVVDMFEEPEFRPPPPEPTTHKVTREPHLIHSGKLHFAFSCLHTPFPLNISSSMSTGTPAALEVELIGSHSLWVFVFFFFARFSVSFLVILSLPSPPSMLCRPIVCGTLECTLLAIWMNTRRLFKANGELYLSPSFLDLMNLNTLLPCSS